MLKKYMVKVNGKVYEVEVEEVGKEDTNMPSPLSIKTDQIKQFPKSEMQSPKIVQPVSSENERNEEEIIRAPMSGTIVKINAKVGENIKDGQTLLTLEAMKMENEILAPRDCKITEILVKEGQQVEIDQFLMKIE
ncbi:MAG: acetyl-CoA carboxylase biotin carboxyl carrier protein subunit [Thermotogae bacterium]|nr:acetyl-CoA carboxylase biotin carboxyl carrier protein subunit [Thermotogota bacterium]MCL5031673.1 acetyl-CoA carboxylase biotin carboxyl carrier protein subunit [Thermotogota bacterium]